MRILRIVLAVIVAAYAGWLAWPFLGPMVALIVGGTGAEGARAGASALSGAGGGLPVAALWIGAVVLYLISALMLGWGNARAAIAYFLGFAADAILRLALAPGSESVSADIAARSVAAEPVASALSVDPHWIVLGALVVIGLVVAFASRRRRRARAPGQLAY